MQITDYISYIFQGDDQESVHQYVTQHPEEYYQEQPDALRMELWKFYYLNVFNASQLSAMSTFLDYHMFRFKGLLSDFVFFVRMSPEWIPMDAVTYINNTRFRADLALILVDWLEKKKQLAQRNPKHFEEQDYRIKAMRDGKPVVIEETESFFVTRLSRPKKRGGKRNIVEKAQVKQWVHTCFHGSDLRLESVKIKVNGTQKDILEAVYEFFDKIDTDTSSTHAYCYMLIDTFDKFSKYVDPVTGEYRVEALQTNFARHGKKTKMFYV
ncbi:hypothetical protein CLV24_10928 [Pontibacter ummariensis]|uniref:Uncharacterized protein n=1 Tax=Pontibacter ummariensis TaxID=1610492 RepID=A0A239FXH5_9BACT|nr:hypothetical protein [Pontibacter ummariensis]PRY11903.1 hypothetical protein CLV24_10928 [Pontibacter ummariensis]SNS60913.1 hypothetical protein SAMN06296052_109142 [Pontibacter ummariensis]